MRVEYIQPFISSLQNAFQMMAGCKPRRGDLRLSGPNCPTHEVSGIIGLSGHAAGMVVLSLSESLALRVTSVMLMSDATEVNSDVVDAVGELANMVAGAAKAELAEYELCVSLPNVVTGLGHQIRFPSNVTPICIPFETEFGPLTLEVGLAAVPLEEPAAT